MQDLTILDAIERYLEWKSGHTTRAYINYRPCLKRFATSVGDKTLSQVTLEDIGRYRLMIDNRYQPYTVQLAMVALHNFFSFYSVQRYDCLPPNLIRVPRHIPKPRPVVSNEDYEKILSYFDSKDTFLFLRDQLLIRMLWDTGVRISELCDMNIDDVTDREAIVRTRKTSRMRQVFWTIETDVLLKEYMIQRKALSSTPALFIGFSLKRVSVRLRPRSVERMVTRVVEEMQIGKKITPHSFRHGKAHKILRMGGNIKHIGAILGHSETNPMAAMHYVQLNNEENRSIAKRFLKEEHKS